MGMCKGCGEIFSSIEMQDGLCKNCISPEEQEIVKAKTERKEEFDGNKHKILRSIIITTETMIDIEIESRISVETAARVYGLNIVKDFFAGIRDLVGGRIESIEKPLNQAQKEITAELKERAYFAGANAIIGFKIEHTYNNANGGGILSVLGSGTFVKLK